MSVTVDPDSGTSVRPFAAADKRVRLIRSPDRFAAETNSVDRHASRDQTIDSVLAVPGLASVLKNDDQFLQQVPGEVIRGETDEGLDSPVATRRSRRAIRSLRSIIRNRRTSREAKREAESFHLSRTELNAGRVRTTAFE